MAVVALLKVITEFPTFPVPFDCKQKRLSGLSVAVPDFDVPGYIDILLRADVFSQVLRG